MPKLSSVRGMAPLLAWLAVAFLGVLAGIPDGKLRVPATALAGIGLVGAAVSALRGTKRSDRTADAGIAPLLGPVIDAIPDPLLLLDAGRRVLAANAAARELLGPRGTGRDLSLWLRHPEVLDAVAAVMGGERRRTVTLTLPVPVQRSFEVHAVRLDEPARPIHAVLVLHDITLAEGAERIRTDFVANVSHELRSPLSSLVGFIETLKGAARDDEAARMRFLDIMEAEADRMARLIDDLLSLSRVEANEHVPPQGEVASLALVEEVAATLAERARERNVRIEISARGNVPPVQGDRDELTEVFHNLIDNALKYGRPGMPVHISIRRVDRIPELGGAGVAFAVRDHGEGIAPEHIPRLTERFYRVDKGRSRSLGGTGLGLAIVKHIVNRHRGRLSIESTLGEGSTFTVYLPVAGEAPAGEAARAFHKSVIGTS